MRRFAIRAGIFSFALLVCALVLLLLQPVWLFWWVERRSAERLIAAVEEFANREGHPPDSADELVRVDVHPRVYYSRDDHVYTVWFGTYLGESCTYRSENKQWEC